MLDKLNDSNFNRFLLYLTATLKNFILYKSNWSEVHFVFDK